MGVDIVHVSDTHIGYENRADDAGRGKTPGLERPDTLAAFAGVVDYAVERGVDAVVHTGDLFDHDIDRDTVEVTMVMLEYLYAHRIQFLFVLGDHDRDAAANNRFGVDPVAELLGAVETERATHLSDRGHPLGASDVAVFGCDASGVGFDEIREGYTLRDWDLSQFQMDATTASTVNVLCLHEPIGDSLPGRVQLGATLDGVDLDLVLLGHEHTPPFEGRWRTSRGGIEFVCAGPTIPITKRHETDPPGFFHVRVDGTRWTVERQTLSIES
jgi:DNA repair exonuclease SbcCD nuclease subunit